MKRLFKSRLVAVITLVALLAVTTNCGFILYPERRGQKEGQIDLNNIDVVVLILDILWFIPGIIPGAVALAVDFLTGCIYLPEQNVKVKPKTSFLLRLQDPAPSQATLSVSLEDPSGAEAVATLFEKEVAQGERVGEVMLRLPAGISAGDYRLAVKVNGETQAAWNLSL